MLPLDALVLQPDSELMRTAAETVHYMQKELGLTVVVEANFLDPLTAELEAFRLEEAGSWGRAGDGHTMPALEVFEPLEATG